MTLRSHRVNVTFEEATAGFLSHLALQNHRSVSSLVRELALEALELREDIYLSNLAESLDAEGAKTIEHQDVWA